MLVVDYWRLLSRSKPFPKNEKGFTLVELSIASGIFAVILLLVAGVIIRFTNNFQRSLTESTTQNTARSVLDSVSQTIQFGGSHFESSPPPNPAYCVNGTRYSYKLGTQLNDPQTESVLKEEQGVGIGCRPDVDAVSSKELLGKNMRLSKFTITQLNNKLFLVTVKIAYGDDDLFSPGTADSPDPVCLQDSGSQFCAVRELSTTVQRRL
jgi:prepilin-type N-terminal cleavage/methylation domain-containing protein